LRIPKKLKENLPFKSKPKDAKKRKKPTLEARRYIYNFPPHYRF
jgi:hypothetical protein